MFVVFMAQKIKTTKYGLEKWGVGIRKSRLNWELQQRNNKKTYKGNRNSIEIDDVCMGMDVEFPINGFCH